MQGNKLMIMTTVGLEYIDLPISTSNTVYNGSLVSTVDSSLTMAVHNDTFLYVPAINSIEVFLVHSGSNGVVDHCGSYTLGTSSSLSSHEMYLSKLQELQQLCL